MFLYPYYYVLIALPHVLTEVNLKKDLDCKQLKCPRKEDPVCVEVSYKKAIKNNSYHVIAYNDCEVGYIKCHPGFKALIVPMRICDHSLQPSIKTQKRHKRRSKRQSRSDKINLGYNYKVASRLDYHYGDRVSSSDEVTPDENKGFREVKQKLTKKKDSLKEVASHEIVDIGGNVPTDQQMKDEEEDQKTASDNEINESDENIQEDQLNSKDAMIELEAKSDELTPKPEGKSHEKEPDDAEEMDNLQEEYKNIDQVASETQETDDDQNRYTSEETKLEHNDKVVDDVPEDYDKIEDANVDLEEYNKDCPSVCPSGHTMICARCGHDIYRTFMSVCHLRVFACRHTDEKLTLVSRIPCIQSAPFLADLAASSGRISEPTDHDRVLQFVRCRAKGLLNKGDPKCTFNDV